MCTREVPSLQCSVIVGWRKALDLSFYFPTPKALYSFLKCTTPSVDTSQSAQRKMFVLNGCRFTAFISQDVHSYQFDLSSFFLNTLEDVKINTNNNVTHS